MDEPAVASIDYSPEHSESVTEVKTYVLDTSVLLSDPWALRKFAC
ncbi:hypothetical protein [Corynebacterium cystitidis]|uniref:PhoH-like ATPase n=1 Tax=Corynebacterium cystitidis DSM 20524 TaxID=1121357 RepID=A0A1H9TLJ9_9CORY|nr:hypothetical protein [Corynebacterium cystitidis]SER98180.1 PhoH-like ATPase [Corynebacterium cystitidis DSM 20524]SNV80455.1 phosphate starvation-inducible protein [Corynebacterium cystitidis]